MLFNNCTLELLGHDSVRITTPDHKVMYFDPFNLPKDQALPKAHLLFVSHTHHDHCSLEDIKSVCSKETSIITVPDAMSKLNDIPCKEVVLMEPSQKRIVDGFEIQTIPAYNINKFRSPGVPYHPKEAGFVGFLLTGSNSTFYFAGDTDLVKEMKALPPIDVAFLPVSGTYVMTAEEAAEAAQVIKPALAIPMHYGAIVGSADDAKRFVDLLNKSGIATEILI